MEEKRKTDKATEKNAAMPKVAAYMRLSREDGDEGESESITNQRAIIREFVRSREYEIKKEYVDDGFTGSNFERPGFKEMIQDIRDGEINCVVVKDLSRFGRNLVEAGRYLDQMFPVWGVRFIAIHDFYDTARADASSETLSVGFKNLINEMYCHDISMKIRATFDMKRRRGDYIGNYPPYGYVKNPENHNKLLVYEPDAQIVRMIFELKLDGMNTRKIADFLNQLNVISPGRRIEEMGYTLSRPLTDGLIWRSAAVARILQDETYTGTLVQGKFKKRSFKKATVSTTDKEEWFRAENAVPAIISKRTYDYVQDLNLRDTGTCKGQSHVYTFSGFLRCGDCGQPMRRIKITRNGKTTITYICSDHAEKKNCSYHRTGEDVIVREVAAAIKEHIEYLLLVEEKLIAHKGIPNRKDFTESMMTSVDRKLKEALDSMAFLQDAKSHIYGDMMSGMLDSEGYRQFSELFVKRIAKMEDEIKDLQKAKESLIDDRYYLIPWIESLREFRGFTELTRRLLVMIVQDIFIFEGNKVKVVFRHEQQIDDLLKMVLNRDEKIVVPRRMNIGETGITPVTIRQPTMPRVMPYFGAEEIDDNGVVISTFNPQIIGTVQMAAGAAAMAGTANTQMAVV